MNKNLSSVKNIEINLKKLVPQAEGVHVIVNKIEPGNVKTTILLDMPNRKKLSASRRAKNVKESVNKCYKLIAKKAGQVIPRSNPKRHKNPRPEDYDYYEDLAS